MLKYRFTTPSDEVEDGEQLVSVTLTLQTDDPDANVAIEYDGDPPLIRRVKAHLANSYGVRGSLGREKTNPRDLNHAIHVSRQLDDYNPERIEDTVDWDKE